MVAARVLLGRGAAVAVAVAFLAVRCIVAALLGAALGHVVPHFPLYLGIALCVEFAFVVARRAGVGAAAALAGALAGTAGLGSEWAFSQLFGREPWHTSMLSGMWLPALAAVAAALLGASLGFAVSRRTVPLSRPATAAAALALVAALVVPLPRSGLALTATVRTTPAGPARLAVDRYGQASIYRPVHVEVDVPPGASWLLRDCDWFWVTSWQGGGRLAQSLREVAPGRWVAAHPVPTGAAWKTVVLLGRGRTLAAIPVAIPADPALRLGAIPVVAARTARFDPASSYLMRESHGGAQWPAVLAYAAWLTMVALWLALVAGGAASLRARRPVGRLPVGGVAMLGLRRMATRVPLHLSR
jgi:hypothetical protein